jgi:predicted metal-dependent hydrolase
LRLEYSVNVELNYRLVRSKKRKKTISLQLREDGAIIIQAPCDILRSEIDRFFHRTKDWIDRKIREKQELQKDNRPKELLPGETFLFLGSSYPLLVNDRYNTLNPLTFSGHEFIFNSEHVHRAKTLLIEWYRANAREYIEERVCHYSRILKLRPGRVRIGNAKKRWGSCSHHNHLSFTWRLIMAPGPVIDYVVAHELVHIKEKNHSNRFWNLLERAVPDYGKHRLWLKEKGHLLNI